MTVPGFGKTLKRSFSDSYDYLGLVLASSFIWFAAMLLVFWLLRSSQAIPLGVRLALSAAVYVFLVAPITAGTHFLGRKISEKDDPAALDILQGARRFLTASWALASAEMLITCVIAANIWFYIIRAMPLKMVGVAFVYVLIVWMMSAIYHYPLLVQQNPGVVKIIRRSFLLLLDNLGFTIAAFLAIIVLTCFTVVTLFGLPLLFAGMASVFQTRFARALFVKYDIVPPEPEPAGQPDEEWRLPEKVSESLPAEDNETA